MEPVSSAYLVPTDHSFSVTDARRAPIDANKDTCKRNSKRTWPQFRIAAHVVCPNQFSLLLVFQAMDAAGKWDDSESALWCQPRRVPSVLL